MFPFILGLSAIAVVFICRRLIRWRRMPPGPLGWPLIGSALAVSQDKPWETWSAMSETYGPLITLTMTINKEDIIINDYETAADMMNLEEFTYKPYTFSFPEGELGIVSSGGRVWKENRRIIKRTFRDFGLEKTSMNNSILTAFRSMVSSSVEGKTGKPLNLSDPIFIAVLNIIWQYVANESFEQNDSRLLTLISSMKSAIHKHLSQPFIVKLFQRRFPLYFRKTLSCLKSKSTFRTRMEEFITDTIQEHIITRDPNFNRDFIDTYLKETESERAKNGKVTKSKFHEKNLLFNIRDLFVAGSETTTTSTCWGLFFMMTNPEVQKKAQEELDSNVGRDRDVSIEDRKSLPYIEAMTLEILRLGCVVPMSVPHTCKRDTYFKGYLIPAGTSIFLNIPHIHHDTKYWENPKQFDPIRFINKEGKVKTGKIPGFVPFGIGKRQCVGEKLGRMEIFLFMANFLNRFHIQPVPGDEVPCPDDAICSVLFRFPPQFRMILSHRK